MLSADHGSGHFSKGATLGAGIAHSNVISKILRGIIRQAGTT